MIDFKAKLKDVPENPGVYFMLDDLGNIIYVGKAKNLKNRLRQYFHNSVKTVKVMAMLDHVADFGYIICASEVDALVTENNLIKKHSPPKNPESSAFRIFSFVSAGHNIICALARNII